MKIISANWIITCDKNSSIIENGAVVFDETIIEIDTLANIEKKYPTIEIEKLDKSKSYKLYCRSGNRSGQTLKIMKELGFKDVENLGSLSEAVRKLNGTCEGPKSC